MSLAVAAPPFLRGPADPDLFRRSHYGTRWYLDPLPADDRWPKTDASWPSVTTIKKAWSKPFRKKLPTGEAVPLDAYWAAEYVVDNHAAIAGLDREGAMALIATCGGRTLNRAANRGTGVHSILEDLAVGKSPDPLMIADDVRPFVPACEAFIDECSPRWLMTEVVAISRTLEFGGTADAIIDIPGVGVALVDWKTRGGEHGAYGEEAAQLGGYSLAEYLVVIDPETGAYERVDVPHLDLGLVVSLTADGYRLYPVDLGEAQEAFAAMRETWKQHRQGTKHARAAIGNPLILAPSTPAASPESTAAPVEMIAWTRDRVAAIVAGLDGRALPIAWPAEAPTFKAADAAGHVHTDAELAAVVEWCNATEDALGLEFAPPAPAVERPAVGTLVERLADSIDAAKVASRAERDALAEETAKANEWADRAMALFLGDAGDGVVVDEDIKRACAEVARCGAGVTMTRERYLCFEAVALEVCRDAGAVEPAFGTNTCRIVASPMAVDRMVEAAGTKTEALKRAKRLIDRLELDLPSPRSVAVAAADPLLAALVAAGHGAEPVAAHTNSSSTNNGNETQA